MADAERCWAVQARCSGSMPAELVAHQPGASDALEQPQCAQRAALASIQQKYNPSTQPHASSYPTKRERELLDELSSAKRARTSLEQLLRSPHESSDQSTAADEAAQLLDALEKELSHDEWTPIADDAWRHALWTQLASLLRAHPSLRTILTVPDAHAQPQNELPAADTRLCPPLHRFFLRLDKNFATQLHRAALADDGPLLSVLLADRRAQMGQVGLGPTLELRDADGCTPLHAAAERGSAKCVSLLLEADASPDSLDDSTARRAKGARLLFLRRRARAMA